MSRRKALVPREEWGWWHEHPRPVRLKLRGIYRALKVRAGAGGFDAVAQDYAKLAAEAMWLAQGASGAAVNEAAKRRYGKGRRPNLAALDRRLKRGGLQVSTMDTLVRRTEELGAKTRRSPFAAAGLGGSG